MEQIELKKQIEQSFEEMIRPIVKGILPLIPFPKDPHRSEKQQQKAAEAELVDFFCMKAINKRMETGLEAIAAELHLIAPNSIGPIFQEWKKAINRLPLLLPSKEKAPSQETPASLAMTSLYEILGISKETIELFYKSGTSLFEKQHYQEAADAFLTVAILNSAQPNPWIAFGLASRKIHKMEEALYAFAMANLVDGTIALPQVYSAECYKELGEQHEVERSLKAAMEIAGQHPEQNPKEVMDYIKTFERRR